MRFSRSLPAALATVSLAVLAASCGGGPSPAVPTPPTPVTAPATPAPVDGGVAAASCPLGKGDPAATCSKGRAELVAAVDAAVDRLVRERPELFNLGEEASPDTGLYRVLDKDAYVDGLIANLRAAGLCAQRTLDRERVELKRSNERSEEWDVLTSAGFIRRGGNAYVQSCEPASFPLDAADVIAYVRTALWAFECDPGVAAPPLLDRQLPLRCDGRVTATPKQRSGRDVPSWVHGTEVAWELRDGQDVVQLEEDPRFPDPFNRVLHTKGKLGGFVLCATVMGNVGCLNGQTIP